MSDAIDLDRPVYADGANRRFGELTEAQVRALAGELGAAVGFGPTARIAPVARAWGELADALAAAGAEQVAALDPAVLAPMVGRLWLRLPGS